ncbi:imelysin family protein [Roseospira navarrensis]|uniref:Imelysin-like domain-containing protein n=1 Tax=Roseospira navarrensis TaxID=140058 RepID=A0A7X1ZGX2_9PROT|nr:imelysin family protein [Roseospira navarrensis]MQX37819.1 hypothetical protein [Roseospira navarrensis]
MRFVSAVCLCAFVLAGPAFADDRAPSTGAALADHLQPRHAALREAAAALETAAADACAAPSPQALATLREHLSATWAAWGALEHVAYGPIEQYNRRFRLAFWPDPRGVVARDLAEVLAEEPEDLLAPNGFTFASVAVQGLPALDRLTHGRQAEALDGAGYRCRLLVGVAGNVATIAADLDAAWRVDDGAWPAAFRDPAEAAMVRDAGQLAGIVLTGMSSQLRAMRDRRLLPVLEDEAAATDDAAGSDRTPVVVAASLDGMAEAFSVLFRPPLETVDPELAGLMTRAFAQTRDTASGLTAPLSAAVGDPDGRAAVERLATQLQALNQLLVERVAPALDLSVGFNSLDGD